MWRHQSSPSHLLLNADPPPPPPVQVLLKVKVLPLLLGETGTAASPLPPAPADDPKHVDQLVSTQFHLKGEHFSVLS